MKCFRAIGASVALAGLAACSGGNGSVAPVRAPVQATSAPSASSRARVKATILLPRIRKSGAVKKRQYVSPSTLGLIIEVDQTVSGSATTVYSDTGYDLSQNTSDVNCMPVSAGTQCTIYLNAPPTSTTSSDSIFIYAYDTAQTSGALTGYSAQGNLLSQDVGTGSGDPVPSPGSGSANASGITAGADNTLTFVLHPVVKTPEASIGSAQAAPLGSSTLVLSAPGTGGASSAVSVDGYDAGGNEVVSFLAGGSTGDDVYVNAIAEAVVSSTPAGAQFTLGMGTGSAFTATTTSTLTSATADAVTVSYAPGSGDAPTSSATAVPYGTATFSDSFSGGFGGSTTYATVSSSVEIAPLFGYAGSATTGFSGKVYALQAARPTGATYSLSIDPAANNDCSSYTSANSGSISGPAAGSGTDQQAVFSLTAGADTGSGGGCTLDLSDGFSTVAVSLPSTGASATTVIPSKYAQPVYDEAGTIAAGKTFSFAARNANDTLVCLESVVSSTFSNASTTSTYPIHPITQSAPSDTSDGMGTSYSATSPYTGIAGYAVDANAAGVTLSIGAATGSPATYWCGEYQLTSAYDISAISVGAFELGNAATTPLVSPGMNDVVIVAVGGTDPTAYSVNAGGFKQNASVVEATNVPASLFVESLSGLTPNTNQLQYTVAGGSGASDSTGFVFIPITSGGSSNFGSARLR